jgi:cell wall-associated NlpC family hydrolase
MTINDYIGLEYEDGGRGPERMDCWGLVRAVRHEIFGFPLLPSFGHIRPTMALQFTRAANDVVKDLTECKPEPGAMAGLFRGKVCFHVAIVVEVDGMLGVLDTTSKIGCRWMSISDFERRALKVKYYK